METLNNAASAASRAIWGDNTTKTTDTTAEEPISGKTGNTAAGEPYDAGNLDSTGTGKTTTGPHESNIGNKVDPTVDSTGSSSGVYNTKFASEIDPNTSNNTSNSSNAGPHDSNLANKADPTVDSDRDGSATVGNTSSNAGPHDSNLANKADPTVDSDRDGSTTVGNSSSSGLPDRTNDPTSTASDIPGNTTKTGPIRPEHDTDKTGVTSANQPSNAFGDDRPTNRNDNSGAGAAPSVGAAPESGAQPTTKQQGADKPTTGPEGADEHAAVKESKNAAEESQESGSVATEPQGPGPKVLGSGGDAEKKDDGPQTESHGEGTGEKYVKSSGLKADGGDFDAANPGAGKEADRLLETKGIKKEQPAEGTGGTGKAEVEAKNDLSESGKPSLKEKIKAKLHKN